MSKPLRVAFFGPAGAGKSTQATLLRQKYKGDVLSFATPLKKTARDLYGDALNDEHFARRAYQAFGQMTRFVAGPSFWVDKLILKVSPDRNCFVDDLRFMSEYHALARLGFVFIRLDAGEATRRQRRPAMTPEQWAHESELAWVTLRPDLALPTDGDDAETIHQRIIAKLPSLTREPVNV